jgi:Aldo/keto reductase family
MRYTKLGTTGLDVSPVAIGAMTYGDPGRGHPVWSLDEKTSRPLIKHALETGINFFDTANLYSYGSSEEILGRALHDFADRDEIVIATKLRHQMRPGPNGTGLSRKEIMTDADHSLRRLGTDYIDLYQIHRNDHAPVARPTHVRGEAVEIHVQYGDAGLRPSGGVSVNARELPWSAVQWAGNRHNASGLASPGELADIVLEALQVFRYLQFLRSRSDQPVRSAARFSAVHCRPKRRKIIQRTVPGHPGGCPGRQPGRLRHREEAGVGRVRDGSVLNWRAAP